MTGLGQAVAASTELEGSPVAPTAAERCVATSRGVVFATVLILKQAELIAEASYVAPLSILNLLALFYITATCIQSVMGREALRLRLPLLAVDTLLVTGLVQVSGVTRNEYYLLYYLPILQAGVRLTLRDAVATAALAAGLYSLVSLLSGDAGPVEVSATARTATFGVSAVLMAVIFGLVSQDVRAQLRRHDAVARLGEAICTRADVLTADPSEAGEADAVGAVGPVAASFRLTEVAPRSVLGLIAASLGAECRLMRIEAHGDRSAYWVISAPTDRVTPDRVKQFARRAIELTARDRQAMVLPTVRAQPELAEFRDVVRTALVLPLKLTRRTVATAVLCDKQATTSSPGREYNEADLRLACALAPQAALLLDYARVHQEMQSVLSRAVGTLAAAIDAKDPDTRGHSDRVTAYAVFLAQAMDLPPESVEAVELAALLHDVGKIGMDEKLLRGKQALDEAEWTMVRAHPVIGGRIFEQLEELSFVLPALRHHHERFDGSGYPDGLTGSDTPLLARIVAIADAFDAMTHERPYRESRLGLREACDELLRGAGTQFDPDLVSVFVRHADVDLIERAQKDGASHLSLSRDIEELAAV